MSMDQKNQQGSFSISGGGYIAIGSAALRKAQEEETKNTQIQFQVKMQAISQAQNQLDGLSEAITQSAKADADTQMWQGITEGADAAISTVQMGCSIRSGKKYNAETSELSEESSNLKKFSTQFNNAEPAPTSVTDDLESRQTQLTPEHVTERMNKLLGRETPYKLEDGDDEVFRHIKSNPDNRRQMAKNIARAKDTVVRKENTASNNYQTASARQGIVTAIANHITEGALKAPTAIIAKDKGKAEQAKAAAQWAQQLATNLIADQQEAAVASEQQAAATNRGLAALASNGTGGNG